MSPTRRILTAVALSALVGTALSAGATMAGTLRTVIPMIGPPITTPAQAMAGKRFTVSYMVTRSDTGAPLTNGTMICDPSAAGKVIPHAESFRSGVARLSFVIPASAAGKLLKVRVTIRSGGQSATKVSRFKVLGTLAKPTLSIADASVVEGNAGTTTLSFPVTLSAKSTETVSVAYATADGTATAPADYTSAGGTLSFKPGETAKTITVSVIGDLSIEPDETLTLTLANPVKATIADGLATGAIRNDDTAVPITAGNYKGATQNGDYVFLTVRPDRTLTGFRVNNIKETCGGGWYLTGSIDWTNNVWTIRDDGTFAAEGSWTGSQIQGDIEWTSWYAKVTGTFSGTTVNGTLIVSDELNYQGMHLKCSSGEKTWSAALQG